MIYTFITTTIYFLGLRILVDEITFTHNYPPLFITGVVLGFSLILSLVIKYVDEISEV